MKEQTYYYCTYDIKNDQQVSTFGTTDKYEIVKQYLMYLTNGDVNCLKFWKKKGAKRIDCTARLNKYMRKI